MAEPAKKLPENSSPQTNKPSVGTDNIVSFEEAKRDRDTTTEAGIQKTPPSTNKASEITDFQKFRQERELARQFQQAQRNSKRQTKEEESNKLTRAGKQLGQTAQIAGQTTQAAGKGIQTMSKIAEPVARAATGAATGAIGGVGGAIGGAIAGSVIPGAGTLAGAAAGARTGASGGYKIGSMIGGAAAKSAQAAGKGIEKTGETAKNAGKGLKKSGQSLKKTSQATEEAKSKISKFIPKGNPVGLVGYILFTILGACAIIIDILPFITGDLGSIIDWILDIGFFFAVWICLVVITQDILGSMIGRKTVINIVQTIAEFIPIIDIMPFHVLAIMIIFLDVKYGILNIKNLINNLKP